jgi:hypothetical protein
VNYAEANLALGGRVENALVVELRGRLSKNYMKNAAPGSRPVEAV